MVAQVVDLARARTELLHLEMPIPVPQEVLVETVVLAEQQQQALQEMVATPDRVEMVALGESVISEPREKLLRLQFLVVLVAQVVQGALPV